MNNTISYNAWLSDYHQNYKDNGLRLGQHFYNTFRYSVDVGQCLFSLEWALLWEETDYSHTEVLISNIIRENKWDWINLPIPNR